MDIEKRVEGLEIRVAALEDERHGPKITPFNLPAPVSEPQEPAIPNTLFQVPAVPVAQAVYLVYLRFPDGREAWYGMRPRTEYAAEIRPVTDQEIAVAERCGRDVAGQLTVGPFLPFPQGAEVVRKVRNPYLPIPKGCKIINEWELVPEV